MGHVPKILGLFVWGEKSACGRLLGGTKLIMDPTLTGISPNIRIWDLLRNPYFPKSQNRDFENEFPRQGSRDTAHQAYIPHTLGYRGGGVAIGGMGVGGGNKNCKTVAP